ncbi:MAG: 50S ribosomal protein L17 [Planctomycetes bacterium]|jgi:large subunit ribosomal protein L17|nr:50S ribosomal protein L17 [Planctomycetota bacterium]
MRHRNKNKILDRKKGPREMMLKNLASSILIYEKVKTTEAKAKVVRSLVEKAITTAKKADLSSHKELISTLPQKMAVRKAIEVLKDRYQDRKGGYTRIIKLGDRQGDGAKIVQIELV